nr:hypothetical protein [uncultured Massilia sp.]
MNEVSDKETHEESEAILVRGDVRNMTRMSLTNISSFDIAVSSSPLSSGLSPFSR